MSTALIRCIQCVRLVQLAGNHFLTLTGDLDRLADIGRDTLWSGAKEITFDAP
jgi:hypothetical protein